MCCRTATEPDKRGQKGKMTRQKADWEITDSKIQGDEDQGPMGATGNRIQVQAQHCEKTVFLFSPKRQTLRNPHSQPASHSQQTLIYQLKICTKEMKNFGLRKVPLFHLLEGKGNLSSAI